MATTASGEGFDPNLEMFRVIVFSWGAATSLGLVGDNVIPVVDAGQTLFSVGSATIGRIVSIQTGI